MTFIDKFSKTISTNVGLSAEEHEIMKYGLKVLYTNIGKTIVLVLFTILLGIFKETAILFGSFLLVRATGFGVHSNHTTKCTIVGLIQFVGSTYIAMFCMPFSIITSIVLYVLSMSIFVIWAPVETLKRPISNKRKKIFKGITLLSTSILFFISQGLGEVLYRNLLIMGFFVEAITMLPPIRKLII